MVGAIVNGNIVPLDYKLQDNDIIKINTNKSSFPSREWISMAYTQQAKNKIRAYFNRIDKEENLKRGEDALIKELRKKRIAASDFFNDENIDKILDELHIGDLTELYIGIGNNKYTPISVINIIYGKDLTKEEYVLSKVNNAKVKTDSKNAILVEGIDEIKTNIASCCNPIPGDSIVGYISKGNGINIHRSICPNISELEERIIEVNWNKDIVKKYLAGVLVYTNELKNILVDIVAKTSSLDIMVQSVNTITNANSYIFERYVLVQDLEKLNKFMRELENLSTVTKVERLIK